MGFAIIETAIGLILVFLVMSLICSALREMIESLLKQRAVDLERGIRELLRDPDGKGLTSALYSHPLVFGLFSGKYVPQQLTGKLSVWFGRGRNLPSYIPTSTFAHALVDLYKEGKINKIYHPETADLMRVLSQGAGDAAQLRKNVEDWFDGTAERMSGWYKRRTYAVLLALGIVTAIVFNVNAVVIAHELYNRSDLRAAVNASAERVVASGLDTKECMQQPESQQDARCALNASVKKLNELASQGLPIGWKSSARLSAFAAGEYTPVIGWPIIFLGWLATGLSVTFGAPFWFDILSKFVAVRSTMKALKPEAPPAAKPAASPETPTAPPPTPKKEQVPAAVGARTNGDHAAPASTVPFQPNQWRDFREGDEEGDL